MRTIKNRLFTGKLLYLIVLCNYFLTDEIKATDYCSWSSVAMEYRPTQKLMLKLKTEYRTKENFSKTDRYSINTGVTYKLFNFLDAKAAYEFIHSKTPQNWSAGHRYNIGLQGYIHAGKIRFALRERFQQTFNGGNTTTILRSRLKADYNIPNTIFTPFVSVEYFNKIDEGEFQKSFRTRYIPGVKISPSRKYSMNLYYCRQNEKIQSKNILGLDLVVKL